MNRKGKKEKRGAASLVTDPESGLLVTKSPAGVKVSSDQVRAALEEQPIEAERAPRRKTSRGKRSVAKPNTPNIHLLKKVRKVMRLINRGQRLSRQIAKELRELRQKAGLSIRQVAERAGVPPSTVRRLEDAEPRWFSLAELLRDIGAKLRAKRDYERLKRRQRRMSAKGTEHFWNEERGDR